MMKLLAAVSVLIATAQTWATAGNLDPAPFQQRFEVVRNEDQSARMILVTQAETRFRLKPIIDEIIRDIKYARKHDLAGANFQTVMTEMHGSPNWRQEWSLSQLDIARQSFTAAQALDAETLLNNSGVQEVLRLFEDKLKDHLMGTRVMAHLQDKSFFYSRAVALQVATWGFNLARRVLPAGPLLDIANTVIDLAVTNVDARRRFHQHMILFYLENFDPAQLGLTAEEVSRARSSIYESRIPWYGFTESDFAKQNWLTYGNSLFQGDWRRGGTNLGENAGRYDEIGDAICYAFREVVQNEERKIVNLLDMKHMFSAEPATSYHFADSEKVERQRRLLRLAQIGLQFLAIPNWLSGPFNSFIESMYISQEKTEGALFGWFEASNMRDQSRAVVRQSINPYLRADFQ